MSVLRLSRQAFWGVDPLAEALLRSVYPKGCSQREAREVFEAFSIMVLNPILMEGKMPAAPDRFEAGDNKMFHSRTYNGGYQIYSVGLDEWAWTDNQYISDILRVGLERYYADGVS